MKLSQLFSTTKKTQAGDGDSINYQLLSRAGFINQVAAGVYSYLPLGLLVLNRVAQIVREEMLAIGASEVQLPVLQPRSLWDATGRWDSFDVLYRLKDGSKRDHVLGPSHEEIITPLAREIIQSYRDLPRAAFQIQTKFRDELRPKSGLMRGREFLMKDLYSFHLGADDLDDYYQRVQKAYATIYQRLGLDARLVEASGGTFSKYSHEYQVFIPAGEDTIYYCGQCDFAQNDEIAKVKEGDKCPECGHGQIKQTRGAEVGNIFKLGDRFTKAFDLQVTDDKGQRHYPVMGCYGIGVSRIVGVLVEAHHDDKGIIWPESVAPAQVHLVVLGDESAKAANQLYDDLIKAGVSVLYDDRPVSAGAKFADADLIGIPARLTISPKTLVQDSVELKARTKKEPELIKLSRVVGQLESPSQS